MSRPWYKNIMAKPWARQILNSKSCFSVPVLGPVITKLFTEAFRLVFLIDPHVNDMWSVSVSLLPLPVSLLLP